jgi:hypothetical protein
MKVELTPQEILVIQKALTTHHYVVERVLNGDKILDKATLKEAIDILLTMKNINHKLIK